jgi:hypothetical protein
MVALIGIGMSGFGGSPVVNEARGADAVAAGDVVEDKEDDVVVFPDVSGPQYWILASRIFVTRNAMPSGARLA